MQDIELLMIIVGVPLAVLGAYSMCIGFLMVIIFAAGAGFLGFAAFVALIYFAWPLMLTIFLVVGLFGFWKMHVSPNKNRRMWG